MDGGQLPLMKGLSSMTSVSDFAELLGTSYGKIRYFYYLQDIAKYYSEFKIPKKSGGERIISAPNKQLRTLQIKISHLLNNMYRPKDAAKAFIAGRSIVSNARPHVGKAFVFNVDLQDFFPSITFARIRGMLIAAPYGLSAEVSSVIAHLCTLRGSLPQGAPTSPVISNMICSRLDRELTELARRHKAVYTRYADDITFSFVSSFPYLPESVVLVDKRGENSYGAALGDRFREIIDGNWFSVNPKKTRLQSRYERQVVTGLIVNRKPNIDRRYIRKTSALIYSAEQFGVAGAEDIFKAKNPSADGVEVEYGAHVHGRMLFIHQVKGEHSEVYRRLALRFNSLSLRYKVPLTTGLTSVNGLGKSFEKKFLSRCWVVEVGEGPDVVQGTAFMISNNRLVTCDHLFAKAGGFAGCHVYRLGEDIKYYDLMYFRCEDADIAFIDFKESQNFPYFDIGSEDDLPGVGDRVSVLGFPNHSASKGLNRYWADVTNSFSADKIRYVAIDKNIYSGNSGGAIVNSAERVVGVAALGADNNPQLNNAFICLSTLRRAIAEYDEIHSAS